MLELFYLCKALEFTNCEKARTTIISRINVILSESGC